MGRNMVVSSIDRSARYGINAPDVVAEDFDGQMVILNLGNGHYYSLHGIAPRIWSALLAGHPPGAILLSIETARSELTNASAAFIDRVVKLRLVRPRVDGADGSSGPVPADWAGGEPKIEVFEDLAALIQDSAGRVEVLTDVERATRYEINAPDVVAEDFDGQMVILNLNNGHYYSLHGIASPIWSALLAGHTPGAILLGIGEACPELTDVSSAFVDRLIKLSLVRPRVGGVAGPLGPIAADWTGGEPGIEVFDDLAELIHGDPIHDVDEQAGWPTLQPTP